MKAHAWARLYEPPPSPIGKASDYIAHADDLARKQPGFKAVLWVRESARWKDVEGRLDRQEQYDRDYLQRLGVEVVEVCRVVEAGWHNRQGWNREDYWTWLKIDRRELVKAANLARDLGAVLVARDVTRFLRPYGFTSAKMTGPDGVPTVAEFQQLVELVGGVPLATIIHPDVPLPEVHRQTSEAGLVLKEAKPGRPITDRAKAMKEARRMKADGYSYSKISEHLKVPIPSLHRWCSSIPRIR